MKNSLLIFSVAISAFLISCNPDKDKNENDPLGAYATGIFITNEGSYGNSNGSVSFIGRDSKVEEDVFQKVNGRPLGDVVQSFYIQGSYGYIVVNNSNKVEIVKADNFKSLATIESFEMPRYFVASNDNKGYVSEFVSYAGNGNVKVLDLVTRQVTKTISVGYLPDKMIISGDKLYVLNSGDSTISVINTQLDQVEKTINVKGNPNSIIQNNDGSLSVLCGGTKKYLPDYSLDYANSQPGSIVNVSQAGAVTATYNFLSISATPNSMVKNSSGNLYYFLYNNKICKVIPGSLVADTTGIVKRSFYGLGFDPVAGHILAGNADFVNKSYVFRYDPEGLVIDSIKVGIAPNGFVVK